MSKTTHILSVQPAPAASGIRAGVIIMKEGNTDGHGFAMKTKGDRATGAFLKARLRLRWTGQRAISRSSPPQRRSKTPLTFLEPAFINGSLFDKSGRPEWPARTFFGDREPRENRGRLRHCDGLQASIGHCVERGKAGARFEARSQDTGREMLITARLTGGRPDFSAKGRMGPVCRTVFARIR